MQLTVNWGPAQRNSFHYPILVFMLNLILLLTQTTGEVHYSEIVNITMIVYRLSIYSYLDYSSHFFAASLDGSLGYVLPLPEKTFRRLQMMQNILQKHIPHLASLNPRAYRYFCKNLQCEESLRLLSCWPWRTRRSCRRRHRTIISLMMVFNRNRSQVFTSVVLVQWSPRSKEHLEKRHSLFTNEIKSSSIEHCIEREPVQMLWGARGWRPLS